MRLDQPPIRIGIHEKRRRNGQLLAFDPICGSLEFPIAIDDGAGRLCARECPDLVRWRARAISGGADTARVRGLTGLLLSDRHGSLQPDGLSRAPGMRRLASVARRCFLRTHSRCFRSVHAVPAETAVSCVRTRTVRPQYAFQCVEGRTRVRHSGPHCALSTGVFVLGPHKRDQHQLS